MGLIDSSRLLSKSAAQPASKVHRTVETAKVFLNSIFKSECFQQNFVVLHTLRQDLLSGRGLTGPLEHKIKGRKNLVLAPSQEGQARKERSPLGIL